MFSNYVSDKFSKHLKSDCLKLLDESIKILKNTVAQLLCGSIMIKDLQIILEKRENFQKVVQSMKDEKVNVVMLTLNLREKEFQTYAKVLKTVKEFLNYSIHCKGKYNNLINGFLLCQNFFSRVFRNYSFQQ